MSVVPGVSNLGVLSFVHTELQFTPTRDDASVHVGVAGNSVCGMFAFGDIAIHE